MFLFHLPVLSASRGIFVLVHPDEKQFYPDKIACHFAIASKDANTSIYSSLLGQR
jgi:hypothetical protein